MLVNDIIASLVLYLSLNRAVVFTPPIGFVVPIPSRHIRDGQHIFILYWQKEVQAFNELDRRSNFD